MKKVTTLPGEWYCVTAAAGTTVTASPDGGEPVTLLTMEEAGQASFLAIDNEIVISDDAAIVLPTDAPAAVVSGGGITAKEQTFIKGLMGTIGTITDEQFTAMYAGRADGRIYGTRIPRGSYSTLPAVSDASKVRYGASVGLRWQPATDPGVDDFAGLLINDWQHANGYYDEHGDPRITAFEGSPAFDRDKLTFTVYAPFWWYYGPDFDEPEKYWLLLKTDTNPNDERFHIWPSCRRYDGSIAPYGAHAAFPAAFGKDGKLTSAAGLKPLRDCSYTNVVDMFKQLGRGYGGCNAHVQGFIAFETMFKSGTKDVQSILAGCTNYYTSYNSAATLAYPDTFFPVTEAQAALIDIGNAASIGTSTDRQNVNCHLYADNARVIGKEVIYTDDGASVAYVKILLDPAEVTPFVAKNGVYFTTMWCYTGETNAVIGHFDGSMTSNTNGRHPFRIRGTEVAGGTNIVFCDIVCDNHTNCSNDVLVALDCPPSTDPATIRATYTNVGTIPALGSNAQAWVLDVAIDPVSGAMYPTAWASNGNSGFRSGWWSGNATAELRQFAAGWGHASNAATGGAGSASASYVLAYSHAFRGSRVGGARSGGES